MYSAPHSPYPATPLAPDRRASLPGPGETSQLQADHGDQEVGSEVWQDIVRQLAVS